MKNETVSIGVKPPKVARRARLQVVPAVDVVKGKCVRLTRGDINSLKVYFEDAVEAAKHWEVEGARALHVVDIEAALGIGDNSATIKRILLETGIEVQVAGGVRSLDKALKLKDWGATKIVVGTGFVRNPASLKSFVKALGSKSVVVALDHRSGLAAINGWRKTTSLSVYELARKAQELGAGSILFSSIERDGTMEGPDVESIAKMVSTVTIPVVASGGVSSVNDVVKVALTGASALIIGKALYEGLLTLKDAFKALEASRQA